MKYYFIEGHGTCPVSPNHDEGSWNPNASFRDKLVGEILGAFSQAFSLEDGMDDDAESDEEVETFRQGLLDCVDLGHRFFLTRLSLGEDYENVLRKGLWFIGDHFLSIRPWEPDFKPALASVSSIAVWVRLNELPIEYYNAKALQIIGKAIDNVLRIDTFMASETRGRKNRTKHLKSGGTSPRQSSAFSFRDNGNVEKDSLVRADALHRPLREVKRKLSPLNFIDRAQIAAAVQSLRSDGLKQAQYSPSLMLKSGESKPTSTQPRTAYILQRFSSVKGKKGAAHSGFTFGEHSNVVRGSNSPCDMASEPEVSADMMGSYGQCSKSVASVKVADGIPSSASTSSTVGFQGCDSGIAESIHEVVQVGNQVRDASMADPHHEVVQSQLHESINEYSDNNGAKDADGEVTILGFGMGRPCAMQYEVTGGDGDRGFTAHGFSISVRSSDERGVGADSMELEGGGEIDEPQC
ncbi:hypothetical protein SO802_026767 [Lithocarpus litseifolius]|uniref:DUF4283 domain-containing protein n=1 Tax=Lithocarpus litseifolius TaxID=425828 RepID=A0AAW2C101_9ROSI